MPEHALIAIIGTSMRFPGNIMSLTDLHERLMQKTDAITGVPEDRWNANDHYQAASGNGPSINNKRGGFMEGVKHFDAGLFGISPAEAMVMDPQIRISMELAFRLFEDAGYHDGHLQGSATGVYMGACFNDYRDLCYATPHPGINAHTITGNTNCCVSGRIAFHFGLEGPCITVDTACSSSLVAVHYGVRDLLSGDTDMAVAGGVNVMVRPQNHMAFTSLNALSPDGICHSFDAKANGYVRSEGAGMILMKRLEDAIADKDRILGVIRASQVNNDGRSKSFTAPNPEAQSRLIRKSLAQGGITSRQVDYIEAHGPGTYVGDPIELNAIAAVFDDAQRSSPLYVGSIKSNIGHAESASGIASLLKALAVVHHRTIYPNIHFQDPNPRFHWDSSLIRVPVEPLALQGTLRAGVNSFGISGTNVHLLMESYDGFIREEEPAPFQLPYLLPVSASDTEPLKQRVAQLGNWLSENPEALLHKAATVARFGPHLSCRELIWADTDRELLDKMSSLVPDQYHERDRSTALKVFVFSGQGGLWDGMGHELMARFPTFRASMEDSLSRIQGELGLDLMSGFSQIPQEEVARQLLTFCYQLALADTLESIGIRPDLVIGHSLGEVVAACHAGLITKTTAIRIVEARASAMNLIAGKGTMWVVGMAKHDYDLLYASDHPELDVAAENGPNTLVLSGPIEQFQRLAAELDKRDIFNRQTQINYASHSRYVEETIPFFRDKIKDLHFEGHAKRTRVFSTSQLRYVEQDEAGVDYWLDNIRLPVRYKEAVESICQETSVLGMEVSSHGLLSGVSNEIVEDHPARSFFLPVIFKERSECTSILQFLRTIYRMHVDIFWDAIYLGHGDRHVSVPPYPMQKKEYWIGGETGIDQEALPVLAVMESPDDWKQYLKRLISSATMMPLHEIGEDRSFRSLGLDSLMVLKLKKQLESQKGISLSSTAFWNYPDITSMAAFLAGMGHEAHEDTRTDAADMSDEEVNKELDALFEELL